MFVKEWLQAVVQRLTQASIGTARLDTLVLLEDITGKDRAWLLAHPEFELHHDQVQELDELVERRAKHEPLAFIRGKTEFYGRTFLLSHDVLEPRPESEAMIDLLKDLPLFNGTTKSAQTGTESTKPSAAAQVGQLPQSANNGTELDRKAPEAVHIADVGTGSGALGITAKLELPDTEVELLEIDGKAIEVAKRNVDLFTLSISVIKSDLLAQSPQNYDVLLCNLPYVPDTYTINDAALHEPKIAIFGGPDGLDLYRKLFEQLQIVDKKPLYILTEALPLQHADLAAIATKYAYELLKTVDFIQLFGRK